MSRSLLPPPLLNPPPSLSHSLSLRLPQNQLLSLRPPRQTPISLHSNLLNPPRPQSLSLSHSPSLSQIRRRLPTLRL